MVLFMLKKKYLQNFKLWYDWIIQTSVFVIWFDAEKCNPRNGFVLHNCQAKHVVSSYTVREILSVYVFIFLEKKAAIAKDQRGRFLCTTYAGQGSPGIMNMRSVANILFYIKTREREVVDMYDGF